MEVNRTEKEYREVIETCRELFKKKMYDYNVAWRVLRPTSLTDQIYIKAQRIRVIEETEKLVDEGIVSEFIGIVNYCIMAQIQLKLGNTTFEDIDAEKALGLYDETYEETLALMLRKNHDYGEAWRMMRISSYTDLILMKIHRTKHIEKLGGETLVSEGVASNYMDMMNYAVFALIRLIVEKEVVK